MKQSTNAMNDLARTLNTPANAIRILQAQLELLARSVGSLFIPALQAVLPVITAIVVLLREAISALASFIGFEMPEIDYTSNTNTGFGAMASDIGDVGTAAKKTAKEMNYLIGGFDELNVMNKDASSSSGGSGSGGGVGGNILGGIDLPEYDIFSGLVESNMQKALKSIKNFVNGVKSVIKPIMPTLKGIAAAIVSAFAIKKFSNFLTFLKNLSLFKAIVPWIKEFKNALFASDDVIASLSNTFTKFKNSLSLTTKIMIGAGGFIATFVTAFDAMSKFAQGTMSATEAFLNIGVVAGIAGAAMYAFLGPIGLVIAAAGTAAGAFFGYAKGVKESAEAAYEASEQYTVVQSILSNSQEIIDRSQSSIDAMATSLDNLNSLDTEWLTIRSLVDDIYELSENTNKSAYETTLLRTKVEALNSMGVPDLNLSLNETGTAVIQAKDEIYKLIDALEEQARMAALQDVLTEAYKIQFESAMDAIQAENDLKAAYDINRDALKEKNDLYWELEDKYGRFAGMVSLFSEDYQEASIRYEESEDALNNAKDAYGLASDALYDSSRTVEDANTMLTDLYSSMNDLETKQNFPDIVSQALDLTGVGEKLKADGYDIGNNINLGLVNGINQNSDLASAASTSMIEGVNAAARNEAGINSPSTVFKEFGFYIDQGLTEGIKQNDNLPVTAVKTMISSVRKAAESELGIVKGRSQKFIEYGSVIGNSIASGINASTVSATNALRNLLNALLNQLESFSDSLAQGINRTISNYASTAASIRQVGNSVSFDSMSGVTVPKLASGGVAYDDAVVEIGEYSNASNNPEIVTPQNIMRETMTEAMREITAEIIAAIYSANDATARAVTDKDTSVRLDSDVIATSVNRANRNRGYDIGLTPV